MPRESRNIIYQAQSRIISPSRGIYFCLSLDAGRHALTCYCPVKM